MNWVGGERTRVKGAHSEKEKHNRAAVKSERAKMELPSHMLGKSFDIVSVETLRNMNAIPDRKRRPPPEMVDLTPRRGHGQQRSVCKNKPLLLYDSRSLTKRPLDYASKPTPVFLPPLSPTSQTSRLHPTPYIPDSLGDNSPTISCDVYSNSKTMESRRCESNVEDMTVAAAVGKGVIHPFSIQNTQKERKESASIEETDSNHSDILVREYHIKSRLNDISEVENCVEEGNLSLISSKLQMNAKGLPQPCVPMDTQNHRSNVQCLSKGSCAQSHYHSLSMSASPSSPHNRKRKRMSVNERDVESSSNTFHNKNIVHPSVDSTEDVPAKHVDIAMDLREQVLGTKLSEQNVVQNEGNNGLPGTINVRRSNGSVFSCTVIRRKSPVKAPHNVEMTTPTFQKVQKNENQNSFATNTYTNNIHTADVTVTDTHKNEFDFKKVTHISRNDSADDTASRAAMHGLHKTEMRNKLSLDMGHTSVQTKHNEGRPSIPNNKAYSCRAIIDKTEDKQTHFYHGRNILDERREDISTYTLPSKYHQTQSEVLVQSTSDKYDPGNVRAELDVMSDQKESCSTTIVQSDNSTQSGNVKPPLTLTASIGINNPIPIRDPGDSGRMDKKWSDFLIVHKSPVNSSVRGISAKANKHESQVSVLTRYGIQRKTKSFDVPKITNDWITHQAKHISLSKASNPYLHEIRSEQSPSTGNNKQWEEKTTVQATAVTMDNYDRVAESSPGSVEYEVMAVNRAIDVQTNTEGPMYAPMTQPTCARHEWEENVNTVLKKISASVDDMLQRMAYLTSDLRKGVFSEQMCEYEVSQSRFENARAITSSVGNTVSSINTSADTILPPRPSLHDEQTLNALKQERENLSPMGGILSRSSASTQHFPTQQVQGVCTSRASNASKSEEYIRGDVKARCPFPSPIQEESLPKSSVSISYTSEQQWRTPNLTVIHKHHVNESDDRMSDGVVSLTPVRIVKALADTQYTATEQSHISVIAAITKSNANVEDACEELGNQHLPTSTPPLTSTPVCAGASMLIATSICVPTPTSTTTTSQYEKESPSCADKELNTVGMLGIGHEPYTTSADILSDNDQIYCVSPNDLSRKICMADVSTSATQTPLIPAPSKPIMDENTIVACQIDCEETSARPFTRRTKDTFNARRGDVADKNIPTSFPTSPHIYSPLSLVETMKGKQKKIATSTTADVEVENIGQTLLLHGSEYAPDHSLISTPTHIQSPQIKLPNEERTRMITTKQRKLPKASHARLQSTTNDEERAHRATVTHKTTVSPVCNTAKMISCSVKKHQDNPADTNIDTKLYEDILTSSSPNSVNALRSAVYTANNSMLSKIRQCSPNMPLIQSL
eukprot:CFRG4743T1